MSQPEIGYVNILSQEIERQTKLKSAYSVSPIRPSSAEDCTRKNAYRLMEFMKKADYGCAPLAPSVTMLLDHGKAVEHQVIKYFEDNGFEVLYQQQRLTFPTLKSSVDPMFNQPVTGSIDFVLKSGEHMCVADVKSVGGSKWTWDSKTKQLTGMKSVKTLSENAFWIEDVDAFLQEMNDPFLSVNIGQLNFYCNSEFIKTLGIDHAAIIQYCKADSRLRELRFKPSEKLFQKSIQSFIEAIDAAAMGKPESASGHPRESVACTYCQYKHVCPNPTTTPSVEAEQLKEK